MSLQRIAALTGKPITWERIEVPRRRTSPLWQTHRGPDPPTTSTDPITSPAQDHGHTARQKTQTNYPDLTLPLGPHPNPDSDLESGVADLSSRSSSAGDEGKDSDAAVFTTA